MEKVSNKKTFNFIELATKRYNGKYDYSKTIYRGMRNRLIITCPIHGDMEMSGYNHMSGSGCGKCGVILAAVNSRVHTQESYIAKAKEVHGDTYDLSKIMVCRMNDPITVICKKHGEFNIGADKFLLGKGCKECLMDTRRINTEDYIKRANLKHDNKYDYTNIKLKNTSDKIKIGCPIHGEFERGASDHLYAGRGCYECDRIKNIENRKLPLSEFISRSKDIHGDKYDYSNVKIGVNLKKNKVLIGCPIHGPFYQSPAQHLIGSGCNKCGYVKSFEKLTSNKEEFEKKAKVKHNGFYSYDNVNYVNNKTHVLVTCPIHKDFKVRPDNHLNGTTCPVCTESKGETEVREVLEKLNIKYIKEYSIPNFKFKYDFYLPDLNILIEYDGALHFKQVEAFGGLDGLQKIKDRDKEKTQLAELTNYILLRIHYNHKEPMEELLLKNISMYFKYRKGDKFYRNKLSLIKDLDSTEDDRVPDLTPYLLYKK